MLIDALLYLAAQAARDTVTLLWVLTPVDLQDIIRDGIDAA